MLLATATIWIMLLDGNVTRLDGLLLIACLIVFLVTAFMTSKVETPDVELGDSPQWKAWAMTLAGFDCPRHRRPVLVDSATELARAFGISEAVIGLTIVAVGTSLSEPATSLIAAIRKQIEIAVGNIVGSNIFNIFGILGTTALIHPIVADPRFASIDMIWVTIAAMGLSVLAFVLGGLPRVAGIILMATYAGYVALI